MNPQIFVQTERLVYQAIITNMPVTLVTTAGIKIRHKKAVASSIFAIRLFILIRPNRTMEQERLLPAKAEMKNFTVMTAAPMVGG